MSAMQSRSFCTHLFCPFLKWVSIHFTLLKLIRWMLRHLCFTGHLSQSSSGSILLCGAIEDGNPKQRLGTLARLHLEDLVGLGRIVFPPEPRQHLGELRFHLSGTLPALAEAEVEVIFGGFECVRQSDIVQGPASILWQLQIVGAILEPHANVPMHFMKDLVGIILAAIGHIRTERHFRVVSGLPPHSPNKRPSV